MFLEQEDIKVQKKTFKKVKIISDSESEEDDTNAEITLVNTIIKYNNC